MALSTTTIRIQMNEDPDYSIEIQKCMGSCGEYYNFNGVNYDIHFPISWVFQQPYSDEFGPETCYDCFQYGYYNGVFLGYCSTCASVTNFQRGNGMNGNGIEREGAPQTSIWNLYLQNTCLEEIGDINLLNDYNYKISYSTLDVLDLDNDNDTVHYDQLIYNSSSDEDENTVAFSSSTENNQNFVDVSSVDDYDYDYDDDMFMDVDSIS